MKPAYFVAAPALLFAAIALAAPPANTPIDQLPMYGGMDRSQYPELKEGDEKFIAAVTAQFGSREAASAMWADQGFNFYRQDKNDMAMRRFNQAWLLNPRNPDAYWGFASVYNDQQKYCDAAAMMDKAYAAGAIQPAADPDAALMYAGCIAQDAAMAPEKKDAMAKRSEELFAKAYDSSAVRREYTLHNWARARYGVGDYAGSWQKVKDFRQVTGKEFPANFVRVLSEKMPEPK